MHNALHAYIAIPASDQLAGFTNTQTSVIDQITRIGHTLLVIRCYVRTS